MDSLDDNTQALDRFLASVERRALKMAQFATGSTEEKTRARFERFRDLPPEEQERLRRISRWYRNLPPERKKELRERWQSLPPEKRQELREKWQRGTPEDRKSIRRELRQKN